MLALHPRAVITEYAWSAGSCDPCPEPPLTPSDIATLGADALPAVQSTVAGGQVPPEFANYFTLTRLHVRYQRDSLGEDLIFRAAPGIVGGQGVPGSKGELDRSVRPSGSSSGFQGRYIIRHPWAGAIDCPSPQRGIWGGPVQAVAGGGPSVATNTAFAPRGGVELSSMISGNVPELDGQSDKLPSGPTGSQGWPEMPVVSGGGCAACSFVGAGEGLPLYALSLAAGAALFYERRRRRSS